MVPESPRIQTADTGGRVAGTTEHDAREENIQILYERAQSLAASLTATQEDDGRWLWNGGNDLYLTCRTYWALALASKALIPLQPDLLGKAVTNLIHYWFGMHGYQPFLDKLRDKPPARPRQDS